jgi:Immunoglobulin domain
MWTVHRIEIEGTDVQLYCRASGSPAPKITWYDRDDNKISDDGTHYSVSILLCFELPEAQFHLYAGSVHRVLTEA